MTETAHLELKVTNTGVREATTGLKNLEAAGEKVQNRMKHVGGAITGTFLGLSIAGGIGLMVKATVEAEMAAAQLEARLKSTGNQVGMTKDQLLGLASSLQGVTMFDDEAIAGAEAMLLTFTRIGGDVFPRALESILNVSTAMGTDLNSAALQVGKALNDPLKGLGALSRAGIQFTADQKQLIKSLVETGKTADAQKIILGELETQMGNAARASRETLGGAVVGLKNDFMDLLEGDSGSDGIRGAKDSINDLAKTMRDPQVKEGFQAIVSGVISVTASLVEGIGMMGSYILKIKELSELNDKTLSGGQDVKGYTETNLRLAQIGTRKNQLNSPTAKGMPDAATFGGEDKGFLAWRLQNKEAYSRNRELEYLMKERTEMVRRNTSALIEERHQAEEAAKAPKPTKPASTGDLLGEDGDAAPSAKAAKAAAKAAEQAADNRAEDFARLKESLLSAEEAVAASYAQREAIISASAQKGSEEEKELRARSLAERDAQLAQIKAQKNAELTALRESLMSEEDSIRESYARRLAIVADNVSPGDERAALQAKLTAQRDLELGELALTQQAKHDQILEFMLTEEENRLAFQAREMDQLKLDEAAKLISHEEFLLAKKRLEEVHAEEIAQIARDKNAAALMAYGSMFQDLGNMFAAFGGKQSKAAKAAFAVSKALAIAQSIMNIQVAVSEAMKLPYPANFAAMATVVAEGASIVGNIQSIAYGGAHDKGGRIPAGKVGIVGEKGMEFVEGPANVTSRAQTKRMLDKASSGTGGVTAAAPVVHINTTITNTGSETSTSASDERDARELSRLIDNRVRETLQKEERQGGILWKRRNGG